LKIIKLLIVLLLLLLCIVPCLRAENLDQKVFAPQIRYFFECQPYIDNFEDTIAYIAIKNLEEQIGKLTSIEKTFYGDKHLFVPDSIILKLDPDILKQKIGLVSGIKYHRVNIQLAFRQEVKGDKNKSSATCEVVLHF